MNYKSNQTVCAGKKSLSSWDSSACNTEVIISQFKIKCVCSVFTADQVSLINDVSRPLGQNILYFESIKEAIEKDNLTK